MLEDILKSVNEAETEADGDVVYSMTSHQVTSPLSERDGLFVLPDGTVLSE